jgi:DNA-directed RNA polymerase specialized sigma24 family protein
MRIGLGILAASWFFPVLAWGFLALLSEVRKDAPPVLLLVHRGVPALILLAAVIAGSWALVVAALQARDRAIAALASVAASQRARTRALLRRGYSVPEAARLLGKSAEAVESQAIRVP